MSRNCKTIGISRRIEAIAIESNLCAKEWRCALGEWDIGLDVVAVCADANHAVVVTWTDGFVGRFDVASYLEHCPASWQHVLDAGYFQQVRIAETGDTIEWPEGQDVAPETLYEQAIPIDAAR